MADEAVRYEVDSVGVCTLTIDQPNSKMNVLGAETTPALDNRIKQAVADPTVKGVILTSGKSTFMAGGDLKAMGKGDEFAGLTMAQIVDQLLSLSYLIRRMETCGKPVACAINGTALGGGFEIALGCHYRVVADDPEIQLGLPEANVGLMPGGGGTQRLIRMIGVQAAMPLVLQGKVMKPAEALANKLVDAVAPKDQLLAAAKAWLLETGDPVAPWDKKGFKIPGGSSSLEASFRNVFSGGNVNIRANGYGNYPAPEKIMSALYEGAQLPFDKALQIEGKYFVQLLRGPVSRNLIRTMFINKGKADRLDSRPESTAKVKYTKIGVIGAGTMGAGIAFSAAKAGMEVVLIDRDQPSAEKGKGYAAKKLAREIEKGAATREKADAILARIHPTTDYSAMADVQLAIETVFEDRAVKGEVIPKIEAVLGKDAIFATNTSQMPITGLAEFTRQPEKFIGLHFFSPADRMPLVEIIRGKMTSDETLAKALDFVQALRKTPIVVNDSPGFFTSRFIGSFVGESMAMLNEGVNPALIENGARMVGMPMGALSISDAVGLDVAVHASKSRAKDLDEAEPVLNVTGKLVQAGRYGLKNGKGYFDYGEGGEKRLWPGLFELLPTLARQPDVEEVKKRILYAQLAEGARCFAEGVLVDVIDGDLGATLGVGFPAYLGGPFAAMDTIGIAKVVEDCDRLESLYGRMFKLPQIVREMAAKGETFHGDKAPPSPGARAA